MTGEVVPVHALGIGVTFLLAAVASASFVNPAALQVCDLWLGGKGLVNGLRLLLVPASNLGKSNEMDIKHVCCISPRSKGFWQSEACMWAVLVADTWVAPNLASFRNDKKEHRLFFFTILCSSETVHKQEHNCDDLRVYPTWHNRTVLTRRTSCVNGTWNVWIAVFCVLLYLVLTLICIDGGRSCFSAGAAAFASHTWGYESMVVDVSLLVPLYSHPREHVSKYGGIRYFSVGAAIFTHAGARINGGRCFSLGTATFTHTRGHASMVVLSLWFTPARPILSICSPDTGHHRSLRGANHGVHPAAEADPARQELRGGHGDRGCYRRRGAGRGRRGRVDSHPVCAHVFRHG